MDIVYTTDPIMPGAFVKILGTHHESVKVVEYRGALGHNGARLYRILIQRKPSRAYVTLPEDMLEVVKDAPPPKYP